MVYDNSRRPYFNELEIINSWQFIIYFCYYSQIDVSVIFLCNFDFCLV